MNLKPIYWFFVPPSEKSEVLFPRVKEINNRNKNINQADKEYIIYKSSWFKPGFLFHGCASLWYQRNNNRNSNTVCDLTKTYFQCNHGLLPTGDILILVITCVNNHYLNTDIKKCHDNRDTDGDTYVDLVSVDKCDTNTDP